MKINAQQFLLPFLAVFMTDCNLKKKVLKTNVIQLRRL